MTSDEMIRRLQAQFGILGDITEFQPSAETYAVNPGEQLVYGTSPSYVAGGRRLEPTNRTQSGLDGTWSTPTEFNAVLTPFDEKEGSWRSTYNEKGQMTGTPYYEIPKSNWVMDNLSTAALAALAAGVGGYGLLSGAGGAGGVTAASLGELGINTALAAGTPGGIASGLSAASLGELGINTALAAGSEGGIAAGTALSGVEAAPSFFESLNLGKTAFPNAPSYVQQGVNRFGTGLITSGGDPEAAARSALMGGVSDFINPYFSELPKELQSVAKAGVQTALQGGDLESVLKSTAFGAITGNVTQAITGATGSKWAGELASNAIKQALTSGNIDPRNFTASTLAQLAGRAVGAETGNEYLGRAATTAVLGAIKGKDLEDIVKQMAMGALNTPTKKG